MRMTPAQCAMSSFLGEWVPMTEPDRTVRERVAEGHRELVEIAGEDLGFDPQRWHDHLRATNAGGYRWSNKHLGMPRRIAQAVADPEWQAAVAGLRGGDAS